MQNLSYISPKAVVRESPIQGRGLFAIEPIEKGEIVCVKGGYIFNSATLERVSRSLGASEIQITDTFFIGPLSEQEREGSMIFSNHSCDPNIGVQGQIVFVAMRDIEIGEELTHDWAMTDDEAYEMECNCEVPSCRKVISGQDWRKKDLQEKYAGYMSLVPDGEDKKDGVAWGRRPLQFSPHSCFCSSHIERARLTVIGREGGLAPALL